MIVADDSGTSTFKNQEKIGWTAKAGDYDAHAGGITRKAVQSILTATGIKAGEKLLDVASGPGYIAGTAAEQGVTATGVDFAATMVAEAKKNYPQAEFCEGDAEDLEFESNTFDAVTCAFGLLHMAEPEKAMREAFRVLRHGGCYVFTVWASSEKHEFFNLVLNAIETHGTLDVPLPPAPSIFRFSESSECKRVLSAVGFNEIEIKELPLVWQPESPQALINLLEKSSVRTAMLLEMQTGETRQRIYETILETALNFKKGDHLQIAWPAVMAVARKP